MSSAPTSAQLSALWGLTLGDERIRIAVLDGPVDRSHIAFKNASLAWIGGDAAEPESLEGRAAEHGTYIASVVFGQHESAIKGVAPRCSGLLVPIFGDNPDGSVLWCTQEDLAHAITTAVEGGAHVINISGGEFTPSGLAHPILADVLDQCDRQGVLIVAAAGNDGCDCLHVPAAHPSILAVGAANAAGQPLASSNWGGQYQGHGLLAIGESVRGAALRGRLLSRSGTSAATAVVAGVAGLLMSLEIQGGLAPDGPRIRQLLLDSSDPCPSMSPSTCRRYLSGVLNVQRAVSLIAKKDFKMTLNEPTTHVQSSATNVDAAPTFESRELPTSAVRSPSQPIPFFAPSEVAPSACSCGGATGPFVYAFGKIEFGFSSRARYDSFWQHMYEKRTNESPAPYDVQQFLDYLKKSPSDANSVVWTLTLESVPVYAISTAGPNSIYVIEFLKECLDEQRRNRIDRVAIAGVVQGRASLMTGEQLPLVKLELRGTSSFKVSKVVSQAVPGSASNARVKAKREALLDVLDRVYFGRRSLGVAPRDRAINYISMNVRSLEEAFTEADQMKMQLYSIDAQPSAVCRAGSECWDVILEYFFRKEDKPRRVYRITVDVSDVVPVTVGKLRYWPSAD